MSLSLFICTANIIITSRCLKRRKGAFGAGMSIENSRSSISSLGKLIGGGLYRYIYHLGRCLYTRIFGVGLYTQAPSLKCIYLTLPCNIITPKMHQAWIWCSTGHRSEREPDEDAPLSCRYSKTCKSCAVTFIQLSFYFHLL